MNSDKSQSPSPGLAKQILVLAIPALGALIAEPLFLMADSAIVGHLGVAELAGAALGTTVLHTAVGLMIFLLVPEAATQKHLEILSEIAEMLSDADLREKIMASPSVADLHGLITSWQSVQSI